MEEILGEKMRSPISIKKFLTDYNHIIQPTSLPTSYMDIQKSMNLIDDPERFEAIADRCSLDHLLQNEDSHVTKFVPGDVKEQYRTNVTHVMQDALKMKTFKTLLESKESSHRNPFERSREIYKSVQLPVEKENDTLCNFYNDVIITLRFYRPARATHIGQSLEKPVFAEEFECLGSNLLTELRDKISCICNGRRFFDISENPSAKLPEKITDPAFFFINNTFYNDKRNPYNADYSEIIRMWAKKASGLKSLDFQVKRMEETCFFDLTVSLGFPQLYQHHGNCEHVFVVSQIEVITPGAECVHPSQYPRLKSFNFYNNRLCNMCGTLHYSFIVEKSNRQLHDPAYLCSKCFYRFHYVDGKKIGEFKAYRVNDDYKNVQNERDNEHFNYDNNDDEEGNNDIDEADEEQDHEREPYPEKVHKQEISMLGAQQQMTTTTNAAQEEEEDLFDLFEADQSYVVSGIKN